MNHFMIHGCPNSECAFFQKIDRVIKDGFYFRKEGLRKIHRYRCNNCGKRFSASTSTLEFRQKKRRVNLELLYLLASNVSMRRSALALKIHRTTVHRKLIYLAKKARMENEKFLQKLRENPVEHLQFDDLITSVHTKLKPLSISLAVDAKRRFILGAEVGSLPAFGHLARLSRRKYGKRKSEHREKLRLLFSKIADAINPHALVESDEHKNYPPVISEFLPHSKFVQYKGGRGCIVGQGELKKLNYDPLFKLNHTCAMLRANINRLIRKTWCTTKDPEMLQRHLDVYIYFHNQIYLQK